MKKNQHLKGDRPYRLLGSLLSALVLGCCWTSAIAQGPVPAPPPANVIPASQLNSTKSGKTQYYQFDYSADPSQSIAVKGNYKDQIGIRIENINKQVVTITPNIAATDFNTTPPAIFNAFTAVTLPSQGSSGFVAFSVKLIDDNDIQAVSDGKLKSLLKDIEQRFKKISVEIDDQNNHLTRYVELNNYFRQAAIYLGNINDILANCSDPYAQLETDLNKQTVKDFTNPAMGFGDILPVSISANPTTNDFKLDKATNRPLIKLYLDELYSKSQKEFIAVNILLNDNNVAATIKLIADLNTSVADAVGQLKQIKSPNSAEQKIIKDLTNNQELLKLSTNENSIAAVTKAIDIATLNKNAEAFAANQFQAVFKVYDYFKFNNFVYLVTPQRLSTDLTKITVSIAPKDGQVCVATPKVYEVSIRTTHGPKFDFSSGFFANFGGHNFLDQTYRKDSIAGDTKNYVIRQNKNKNFLMPSVGALMHMYWRNGEDFQPAFCLGLSTNDLSKINYHFGGSLIFGSAQRFIFNGGLTLTKAKLISDQYEPDQVIARNTFPSDIPTASFTRIGFFVGLTYNITTK